MIAVQFVILRPPDTIPSSNVEKDLQTESKGSIVHRERKMLHRQSSSIIRLSASHVSRPRHYYRHQPLSVRSAVRPTSRSSHHPTNLPQIYPRSSSPSRKNSTLSSSSRTTATPSRRMRFVRRFVETVLPQHDSADMGRRLYQVW